MWTSTVRHRPPSAIDGFYSFGSRVVRNVKNPHSLHFALLRGIWLRRLHQKGANLSPDCSAMLAWDMSAMH
jgi:hypothetical protein